MHIIEKTAVEKAAHELATQLLNREVEKSGKPMLSGDEHAGQVIAWIEHVEQKIVSLTGFIDFPALPVAERERLSLEGLLGDHHPSQINRDESESALNALNEAAASDLPLDDDETYLRECFLSLDTMLSDAGTGAVAVASGCEDDHLNEQLHYTSIPSWIEDYIDWDKVYERFLSTCDKVDVDGMSYTIIPDLR